jgi:hypothetical protein
MSELVDTLFHEHYRGYFAGILKWEELDLLWQTVNNSNRQWYLYAVGAEPPTEPVASEQLAHSLREIDQLLRREHAESYCGIVYVDSPENPQMIKIYDPDNLGVSCGFSKNPPLPGWIVSTIPPAPIESAAQMTRSRERWWSRLFHQL